jgi:hypothetical protein
MHDSDAHYERTDYVPQDSDVAYGCHECDNEVIEG